MDMGILGIYTLKEDDHIDEETSEINALISMAPAYSLMSNGLLLDYLAVHSLMDDIFSRILALSSHITQQLVFFIENLVLGDVERHSNNLVIFSTRHHPRYSSSLYSSIFYGGSSSSSPGVCEIKNKVLEGELLVNSRYEVLERNYNHEVIPSIFQGLMIPCFCFKLALSFLASCWRLCLSYLGFAQLRIHNIISRIQKTLRGSGDDIGWHNVLLGCLLLRVG